MDEAFPVTAGIAIGLLIGFVPSRLQKLALAVLSLAFGALASWVSEELVIGWIYVLIDVAQVLGAALLTAALVTVARGRSPHAG